MESMEDKEPFIQAINQLSRETRNLFHRLKAAGEQIHHQLGITMGERGILEDISRNGPRTVPQMARARPVSRQHIQTLINSLQENNLVEYTENPDHKRSHLVALTPEGEVCFQTMQQREAEILSKINFGLYTTEIIEAAKVLSKIGEILNSPQTKKLLENQET